MLILSIERQMCVLLSPLQILDVIVCTCALYRCLLILPATADLACQYTCRGSVMVDLCLFILSCMMHATASQGPPKQGKILSGPTASRYFREWLHDGQALVHMEGRSGIGQLQRTQCRCLHQRHPSCWTVCQHTLGPPGQWHPAATGLSLLQQTWAQ